MTHESEPRPEWADNDRPVDLAWIQGHWYLLASVAQMGDAISGRGAVYIDATAGLTDEDTSYWYADQSVVEESAAAEAIRMVARYDPSRELVTVFLKSENRTSTYRIHIS